MQSRPRLSRNEKGSLTILIVICAAMVSYLVIQNPNISNDGILYLLPIHNLMDGKGYTFQGSPMLLMPPGFGIFAYLVYLVIHDIELSGMLVSAIAYILIIPTSYITTRSLFGKKSALLAAFLIAFSPSMLYLAYHNLSDTLYILVVMLSFHYLIRSIFDTSKVKDSIFLGIGLGIAYLIRPEAFLLAVLAFPALLIVSIFSKSNHRQSKWYYSALGLVTFILVALPYILFIHKHTGIWTFSTKTTTQLLAGTITVDGAEEFKRLRSEHPEYFQPDYKMNFLKYFRENRGKLIVQFMKNSRLELVYLVELTIHGLIPTGILALTTPFIFWKDPLQRIRIRREAILIGLCFSIFLSPLFVLPFFILSPRYLVPYTPFLLILLAFAMDTIMSKLVRNLNQVHYNFGFSIISLVILMIASGMVRIFPARKDVGVLSRTIVGLLSTPDEGLAGREAGFWLRDNVPINDKLRIITPRMDLPILFYAFDMKEFQGSAIRIGNETSITDVAAIVRSPQADYLILDSYYVYWLPKMVPLWDDPSIANQYGLKLLYEKPGVFQVYIEND